MKNETILEKFQDQEIAFDLFRGDLMVNATEMARPFGVGKRPEKFLRSKGTKALIKAMQDDQNTEFNYTKSGVVENQILTTKEGQHGGTFMCEDLALAFAMWLSPQFHVWILKTVREIIFGNNPELVREAVVNMPRIQKDLDRLRKKRNRLRNVILGDSRRKNLQSLLSERATVNHQIKSLTEYTAENPLFDQPEQLGRELVRLMKEKDTIQETIRKKEESFNKILIEKEDYFKLMKDVGDLEREQRQYARAIRYSEFKVSQN
ncbi:KilA-N domain-containing protein [Cyclobacterium sp.]|uniref:KilA-N domain-containing protein n=1 Tax=Cyclobacterium sp. TaxID=1966343 RepID=UPI0019AEC6E9|nr:KilA-N domain-containing protein [Cyclobacterium sp.]MBD3627573.1 KilA-N domain-containing protein [Cyclobacterium sp.]